MTADPRHADPRYRERAPQRGARGFVDAFWRASGTNDETRRVLPDGCFDLVWCANTETGAATFALVGLALGPILVPPGPFAFAGVRFRPGAARVVLGVAPAAFVNGGGAPAAVVPDLAPLADALLASASPEQAERLLRAAFDGSSAAFAAPPAWRRVREAVRRLEAGASVSSLAPAVGASERALRRDFEFHVGVSPKAFARIVRFRRAARRLREGDAGLAEIAFDLGYADQAHLTREFRAFAGRPPGAFASEVWPISSRPGAGPRAR